MTPAILQIEKMLYLKVKIAIYERSIQKGESLTIMEGLAILIKEALEKREAQRQEGKKFVLDATAKPQAINVARYHNSKDLSRLLKRETVLLQMDNPNQKTLPRHQVIEGLLRDYINHQGG